MKTKTNTPSPLESSEASQNPKPKEKPLGSTGKKVAVRRNWRDGSMIGARFGKLTVIGAGVPHPTDPVKTRVPCRCECGEEIELLAHNLGPSNACKSCVRLKRSAFVKDNLRIHGRHPKNMYSIWAGMRVRCKNPNHQYWGRYGGRGVSICERWDDFQLFCDDMGPRPSELHTLDRIDNDGNYEPSNCRWATKKDQNCNRKNSRWLKVRSEVKTLAEWSEISGVSSSTILSRISRGWSHETAIFKPTSEIYKK